MPRMGNAEGLAPALKALVHEVERTLGEVVAEAEGTALYEVVEAVRRDMVAVRTRGPRSQRAALARARRRLDALDLDRQALLARAYTLYLELVNVCENAYRTHRLRERHRGRSKPPSGRADAVFVFTAHPTESRSPTNIHLLRRVQGLLVDSLERGRPLDAGALRHLLHLAWRAGTHPPHKPTVEDEARHLCSLLDDAILSELIALRAEGHRVRLRTWVGGDKDGHPGVGPEETAASLQHSRRRLLEFVGRRLLPPLRADLALFAEPPLRDGLEELERALISLEHVSIGDGRRVRRLRAACERLNADYTSRRGAPHPSLRELAALLGLFEGLVLPLELREERGRFGEDEPIADMMRLLNDVARGGEVGWYARGCVVSMTSAPEDLLEAGRLVHRVFGGPLLPLIPLFELPDVLRRACEILDGALEDPAFRDALRSQGDRLEVMLGYSDTSKRMGVLASRVEIHATMAALGAWARERGLALTFFHGSGGSVGRGGGTLQDRAATWPPGACRVVKQTLQGEMVERTLATPEILRSQVEQVAAVQEAPPAPRAVGAVTRALASASEAAFAETIASPEFQELLARATPYTRLRALTIGSRPTSRKAAKGPRSLEDLRAIPWVLCWTQTRYLLHAWLGAGTAWRALRSQPGGPDRLRRALARDPLLRSYLRMLGFTLAKTAPLIWREYARALGASCPGLLRRLERERRDALELARFASEDGELLSYRPWLAESITLRAPMIHPLNLLQIRVLARERLSAAWVRLFRETVTGIAAGMLTTG